jgi:hypothetical protein
MYMKKALLLSLLLFFMVGLSGCLKGEEEKVVAVGDSAPVADNSNKTPVADNQPKVQKFYPKSPEADKPQPNSDSGAITSNDTFVITTDLQAKIYIADKYDPGICYGAPSPVPSVAVDSMISKNPGYAAFVKSKYGLSSDLDIYNKIKQINGVRLEEKSGGSYTYYFTDGQCCVLRAYQGDIDIIGRTISESVTRQDTKNNPC